MYNFDKNLFFEEIEKYNIPYQYIVSEYSGYGDSGNWGVYRLKDDKDQIGISLSKYCQNENRFKSIELLLNQVFNHAYDKYFSGFENGSGGNGTMTIDLNKKSITFVHNTIIADIDTEHISL